MRVILLLALVGVALVVAAIRLLGRRAVVFATACIVAGTAIAWGGVLLVDCRQCHTSSLIVAAFASLPFFAAGIVGLVIAGADAWHRGWLAVVIACGLAQMAWAVPTVWAATLHGQCPCAGWWWAEAGPGLAAIGSDRWLGLLFLAESLLSVIVGWRAYRQPPTR